jgi:hypothetical protein
VVSDEDCRAGLRRDEPGSRWPQPGVQSLKGWAASRHAPLLTALAVHAHNAPIAIEIVDIKTHQLRNPDPGRVQQFQDRHVAQRGGSAQLTRRGDGGGEHLCRLRWLERLGQRTNRFG